MALSGLYDLISAYTTTSGFILASAAALGLYGLILASKASFDLNGLISASMALSGLYGLIMTFTITIRPKRPYPSLRGHARPQRLDLGLHGLEWPLRPYPDLQGLV